MEKEGKTAIDKDLDDVESDLVDHYPVDDESITAESIETREDDDDDMVASASDVILSSPNVDDVNFSPGSGNILPSKPEPAAAGDHDRPSGDGSGKSIASPPVLESGFSPLNRSIHVLSIDDSDWLPSRPEKQRD